MKIIEQYPSLANFTKDLEQQGPLFPFKIMGPKRAGVYYTLSMVKEVYCQTPDPDTTVPFQTMKSPFGEILSRGARLDPANTYSAIRPTAKGENHFQGDILSLELGGNTFPKSRFAMILSHTCDVQKFTHVVVAPAYLESELTDAVVAKLRLRPTTDTRSIKATWFGNEMAPFLTLPAVDLPEVIGGERIVACLYLGCPVPRDLVLSKPPLLRLKYRASSYLQWRLALLQMRDVQNSDETRDI